MLSETDIIHEGIAFRRKGQLAEATDQFRAVLTANPANEWARIELANNLRSIGNAIDAKKVLLEGVSLGKRCPNIRMSLAEVLRSEGQVAEAHAALKQAVTESPESSKPYVALIQHLMSQGDFDLALDCASEALTMLANADHRATVLKEAAAVLSLQHADKVNVKAPVLRSGRPLDNCLYVTLVKDEGDIILTQLNHHYAIGFRYFAIANNASVDCTEEQIKRFRSEHPDAHVLYVEDHIVAYHQDLKTTSLARYAVNYFKACSAQLEWVFPLDADEFISIPNGVGDLRSILEYIDKSGRCVLVYHLCNVATEKPIAELPVDRDLWSVFTVRSHYRQRPVPKVAYRHAPEAMLEVGNHFVKEVASTVDEIWPAAAAGIYVAHHPYRTAAQIRSKVLNGGKAVSSSSAFGAGHWRDYYERYNTEGEALFSRILQNYINTTRKFAV